MELRFISENPVSHARSSAGADSLEPTVFTEKCFFWFLKEISAFPLCSQRLCVRTFFLLTRSLPALGGLPLVARDTEISEWRKWASMALNPKHFNSSASSAPLRETSFLHARSSAEADSLELTEIAE